MSDDERISEIRDIHVAGVGIGAHVCANCYDEWPCDTAYLMARVDALTQERDYLSSCFDELMKAGKSQRDRADKAESERDAAVARLAASEAAFERAVTIPVKHPRFGDDVVDSCWLCGGIGAEDHHYHGPIVHRGGCVLYRAALAASSAEGEG